MLCAECQELLSDYLDGDLSDRQRQQADAHMRDCARCASVRNDLARIIHASASLPLHTPSDRVWEGVRREIGGGSVVAGPRQWWDRLAARRFDFSVSARELVTAAAGLVVLAGTLWAVHVASPGSLPQVNWSELGANQKTQVMPLSMSESREEVADLQTAVDDMTRRLEERQPAWSAELRATYAKTVADFDARIAECRKAYDADGGTEATRVPLMDALRDKLRALDEFARVR
jgi:hypothetical protein